MTQAMTEAARLADEAIRRMYAVRDEVWKSARGSEDVDVGESMMACRTAIEALAALASQPAGAVREPLSEWRVLEIARDNGDESETGFCFNKGDWMSVLTFARDLEAAHGIPARGQQEGGE